jgi:thiol:disulfide interchange protein DsbD
LTPICRFFTISPSIKCFFNSTALSAIGYSIIGRAGNSLYKILKDMKKIVSILFLSILVPFFVSSHVCATSVKVEIIQSQDKYPEGGTYPIILRFTIQKPWYIHGIRDEGDGLIATALSFDDSPILKVSGIRFPEPEKKQLDYVEKITDVYSGEILVRATLEVKRSVPLREHVIQGKLSYQACKETICRRPENLSITIPAMVVPKGTPTMALNQDLFRLSSTDKFVAIDFKGSGPGAGFWLTLLGFFLGGLALNLTPCIYPLIPITVSYFSGRSQKVSSYSILHGILYICGLAVTNSVLGVSAALSGGMLGSALQNPYVLMFVAGILIVLGLSFFGFWEIRIPAGLAKVASKSYGGLFGTFFMGLTLGVVAAPCLGPFILGLLTYVGQKGDPFLGFLYFFVLSIGLGLPLSILAIFSSAIDKLPMSGDWMVWVKKLMGWVLVGMAAYIISPLIPYHLGKSGLLAAIAIAAGIHLGLFDRTGARLPLFLYLKKIAGIIIVAGGIIYLVSSFHQAEGVRWTPYNENIISKAAKDKKPLILDFYADWCLPCKEMDKHVFTDPEILELSRKFVMVRLDLTRKQPFQKEIILKYSIKGVPTAIFLNSEGIEEKSLRTEKLVDKSEFLEKMKWLLEKTTTSQILNNEAIDVSMAALSSPLRRHTTISFPR